MELNNIIKTIIEKYPIDCIGLFGSRARNDHNEYSDYDFFMISDVSIDIELTIEADLEALLKGPVDLVKISKNTDTILLKNIMNDAVILHTENNKYEELYSYVDNFFIENHDFLKLREYDLIHG